MIRISPSSRIVRMLALCSFLFGLSGCENLRNWFSGDRVDYQSASAAPSLVVPPDLSATVRTQHYVAPASSVALGGAPERAVTLAGNRTEDTPTPQDSYGMHVERDGDRRWLIVEGRAPEELWPELQSFWQENGFALATDSRDTGVMETAWAENRANIPNDWFRRTVGKLIDFAYSSGTRDKYRTLVERVPGGTLITITQRGMEEILTGQDKSSSRWQDRPRNPELEAAFLSKLMVKFGLTDQQADALLTQARAAAPRARVVDTTAGSLTLDLSEPFQRAWLRVGLALDRSDFSVDRRDRRDRDKGLYYVRHRDPTEQAKREGLLGKLLSRNTRPERAYVVSVQAQGPDAVRIAVLDADGRVDTSSEARRLIDVLHAQLD